MTSLTIEQQLHQQLSKMPVMQQRQLLDFARTLTSRKAGIQGSDLLSFAGAIPSTDLVEMQSAIEADCEMIDQNEW